MLHEDCSKPLADSGRIEARNMVSALQRSDCFLECIPNKGLSLRPADLDIHIVLIHNTILDVLSYRSIGTSYAMDPISSSIPNHLPPLIIRQIIMYMLPEGLVLVGRQLQLLQGSRRTRYSHSYLLYHLTKVSSIHYSLGPAALNFVGIAARVHTDGVVTSQCLSSRR